MLENMFVLENVQVSLQAKVSKNGINYNACILTVGGVDFMIGFEKEYYSLRKRFNKK